MTTFDHLWALLDPKPEYADRRRAMERDMWNVYSLEKQREIYARIRAKKRRGEFIHENPYYALQQNVNPTPRRVPTLSYGEYYATYRTTEPTDGWRMRKDAAGKVIYVKD